MHAWKAGVRRGMFTGFSMGLTWLIIYASYSIAFWYGSGLIIESRYPNDGPYDPAVLIVVSGVEVWRWCVMWSGAVM